MKPNRSFIAFLIDATAAFFIFQIAALILSYFYFLPFFPSFFAIWLLYYCICFISIGTTLGLSFFNYRLKDSGNRRSYIPRLFFRECLTSFPAVVLWLFSWDSLVLVRIALIAIICLILTFWRKRLLKMKVTKNEEFGSIRVLLNIQQISRSKTIINYGLLIALGTGSFWLNCWFTGDPIIMAEKPTGIRPRPSAHALTEYTDYINTNRKDINDYIKELYSQYDHVVLCERWHPECLQYEMIYDLVTNRYFADSISNVFTEIGNIEKREDFRRLTATAFPVDSLREKALASLIVNSQTVWLVWSNTNWFEFLKKMSIFNHDREKPINILFSDILWKNYNSISERDSIMARNIINTIHSDSIGKSLIIMNYRHAFMTPRNCTYYLQKAFPGKVANVLINTYRPNICQIPSALQQGKWDVAAEHADNDCFAIEFLNSPFGDDSFDLFPRISLITSQNVKYKDMFTGMIYYGRPAQQYAMHGFPYLFTPENQSKLESESAIMPGDRLSNYDYLRYGQLIEKGGNYLENIVYNLIYFFLFTISILLLIVMSISTIRYHKKKCSTRR